jgi:hypothetical protein
LGKASEKSRDWEGIRDLLGLTEVSKLALQLGDPAVEPIKLAVEGFGGSHGSVGPPVEEWLCGAE